MLKDTEKVAGGYSLNKELPKAHFWMDESGDKEPNENRANNSVGKVQSKMKCWNKLILV